MSHRVTHGFISFLRSLDELRNNVASESEQLRQKFQHESATDGSKGFGGKFGVQNDRVDKNAVGWDHHEKLQQHASQKGNLCISNVMVAYWRSFKDYSTGFGG